MTNKYKTLRLLDKMDRLNLQRASERHKYNCPDCGSSDALHAYPDPGKGFFCFSCNKHFDNIALVQSALSLNFQEALGWLRNEFGIRDDHANANVDSRAKRTPQKPYPPKDLINKTWGKCSFAITPEIDNWLQSRGLKARDLQFRELFKIVPEGSGSVLADRGYSVLFPLCNNQGDLSSFKARSIDPQIEPKSITLEGYSAKYLFLANPQLLDFLAQARKIEEIVICEGEIDYLTACVIWPDKPIMGIFSGSWGSNLANKINKLAPKVHIYTHNDKAGDRYAQQIINSLPSCEITRTALPDGQDLNDLLRSGQIMSFLETEKPKIQVTFEWRTGSSNEAYRYLLQRLTAESDGIQPVYTDNDFYCYNPVTGIWDLKTESEIWQILQSVETIEIAQKTVELKAMAKGSALKELQHACDRPDFFRGATHGVGFANGVLRAKDGDLVFGQFDPNYRLKYAYEFAYEPDRDLLCQRWTSFLRECFSHENDNNIKVIHQILQEYIGICLFGLATRYQQALILISEGSNGKSQFADVVRGLFPPGSIASVSPHQLDSADGESRFAKHNLLDKLINIVNEIPERKLLSSEIIKSIISGDTIRADIKLKNAINFAPYAGHIFAGNSLPVYNDFSYGFLRRWIVIKWTDQLPEQPERDLGQRIISKDYYNERSSIVHWAIKGAQAALERDRYLVNPQDTLSAWRRDSDPVAAWIEQETEPVNEFDVKDFTSAKFLYEKYIKWAKDNGYHQLSSNSFGRRLAALKIPHIHVRAGETWAIKILLPLQIEQSAF